MEGRSGVTAIGSFYNEAPYRIAAPARPANALKVALVGSRTFTNIKLATRVVARLLERDPNVVIISGGASGADSLAELLAKRMCRQPPRIIRAKWQRADGTTDRRAGHDRNTLLVRAADEVVALWDGTSRGTLDTVRKSLAAGKPTYVYSTVSKRWLKPDETRAIARSDAF